MAQSSVNTSELPVVPRPGRMIILKSKWYPEYVESMARACVRVLSECGYTQIDQHTLPGSLEIPLAARDLLHADSGREIDAVICFGVILKGETLHFEMIANESMRALGDISQSFRRPVIVEILPVFKIEEAASRSGDDEFNKGIEAAVAAIEMTAWRQMNGVA